MTTMTNLCHRSFGRSVRPTVGWLLLTLCTILLPSLPVAQNSPITVAMDGDDPTERRDAERVALRIYLLRNSADQTLLGNEKIRAALFDPTPFVASAELGVAEQSTADSGPRTARAEAAGRASHILRVTPDEAALQTLIQQIRPAAAEDGSDQYVEPGLLVWIALRDGESVHIIGGQSGQRLMSRMREIAAGHGLPLEFPAAGAPAAGAPAAGAPAAGAPAAGAPAAGAPAAGDARQKFESLVQATPEHLLALSATYRREQVLRGIVTRQGNGGWQTDWLLLQGELQNTFSDTAANLDRVLQNGLRWVAGVTPGVSAPAPSALPSRLSGRGEAGRLWLARLNGPADYQQVMSALLELEWLENVRLSELSADGALVSVKPSTEVFRVAEFLVQQGWFRQDESAAPESADVSLVYMR